MNMLDSDLCRYCSGRGNVEGLNGPVPCRHCHGSGLTNSESCSYCHGNGSIVDKGGARIACSICGGGGRMPYVRIRDVTPIRRLGGGDRVIGFDVEGLGPRMSSEYAPPADADAAMRSERVSGIYTPQQAQYNAARALGMLENFRNAFAPDSNISSSIAAGGTVPTTQISPMTEKASQCLRITQLIFRNTEIITFNEKTETMAALLMKLPDEDIKTIRNLLEDFTVEYIPEKSKPLNRFQILKQL